MGFIKTFFANTRKPQGFLGKIMLNGMNRGHARCADWGMEHIGDLVPASILDCGCGGGRNIQALLSRYPKAVAWGLDYSEISVEKTREVNKAAIEAGRCNVVQGDVSDLPFDENSFNLVTAFETVYFWPDIEKSFGEVKRVLKPGGMFLIGCETNGAGFFMRLCEGLMNMTAYTDNDLCQFLGNNDFKEIKTYLRDGKSKKEIIKYDGKEITMDDDYNHFSISDRFVQWMTVTAKK